MTDDVTLTKLAAEIVGLRQQIDTLTRRIDAVYGALTRLSEQLPAAPPPPSPESARPAGPQPATAASEVMTPGSMLDALRQHAEQLGMDISPQAVDRLKSHLEETDDES